MNILFDGNFLIHKTFSVWSQYCQKKDNTPEQNHDALVAAMKDKEQQQVFIRKIIIDACAAINRFKDVKQVAFVIDSSSWRYQFYKDYKYALTRVREDWYPDFVNLIGLVEEFLRKKGFIVSRVMGAEGDDLLYLWSIYYSQVLEEDLVIVTGDSDIRQIMNDKVSIFCNNSKILKMYCIPEREVFWNEYLETDVIVEAVNPFEIMLYKTIMGDGSDNIPKLKKGFGNVAFAKFLKAIRPYNVPEGYSVVEMGQWIADRFCTFAKVNYEETLGQILFNLNMTWLNLSVYNEMNFQYENGKSLLVNMLDDIEAKKNSFSYNKDEYSLEQIYNYIIK